MKYNFYKPGNISGFSNLSENDYCLQPKIDGHRLIINFENNDFKAITRNKKNIAKYLNHLDQKIILKNTILDGEIYHYDGLYHLNYLLSIDPKKSNQYQHRTKRLDYYIFDVISYRGLNCREYPYYKRLEILDLIFKSLYRKTNFKKIKTYFNNFKKHVENLKFIGNEGVVFKNLNGNYSNQGYKFKFKKDYSFIIKKINKKNNKLISIELGYYDNWSLISAGKIRTNEYLIRLFESKRLKIGDIVDVECLELTNDLKPRDGSFKCLRPDLNPITITSNYLKSS